MSKRKNKEKDSFDNKDYVRSRTQTKIDDKFLRFGDVSDKEMVIVDSKTIKFKNKK